jgi:hypothetical protein
MNLLSTINLILLQYHGKSYYAMPHDSTNGFTYFEQWVISGIILILGAYVAFLVRRNLKNRR